MQPFSLYSLQLLYSLRSLTTAQCFYPNGQASDDLECDPEEPETACCPRGYTCLSNGLCELTNSSGIANYGRGSCTDLSWRSTLCPQFCQSGEASYLSPYLVNPHACAQYTDIVGKVTEGAIVYDCGGGENWCCDKNLVYQGCCSTSIDLLNLGIGTSLTVLGSVTPAMMLSSTPLIPPSSNLAPISKASSTSTSTTVPIPLTDSQSDIRTQASPTSAPANAVTSASKSNDLSAKIGPSVGVPLGVALIVALTYIFFRLKNRSSHSKTHPYSSSNNETVIQEREQFSPTSAVDRDGRDEVTEELDTMSVARVPQLDGQARDGIVQLPA